MKSGKPVVATALLLGMIAAPAIAAKLRQPTGDNPIPEISEAMLADEVSVELGKEIWIEQCQHCHGAKAYPGKAPKLKPRIYSPEFVYDRVTFGFRKMPAWEEVYDETERQGLVAWIMSKKFRP